MMSMLCNCCVRELLIMARTWFAFGLPSKTGCDTAEPGSTRARQRDLAAGTALARRQATAWRAWRAPASRGHSPAPAAGAGMVRPRPATTRLARGQQPHGRLAASNRTGGSRPASAQAARGQQPHGRRDQQLQGRLCQPWPHGCASTPQPRGRVAQPRCRLAKAQAGAPWRGLAP
jgi:hypothetical protein